MPRRIPHRRSLLLGALAALATGCGSGSGSPGGGREPSPTRTRTPDPAAPAASTTPAPSATAPPGRPSPPGKLLLNWLTTGGFAGVHVQTLLYADGTYTVSAEHEPSRTGRMPDGRTARVRALLEQARLGRQPRHSLDRHLRDAFRYRIAYDGHVVHRDDRTLEEPLRKVRALLPSP